MIDYILKKMEVYLGIKKIILKFAID